MKGFLLKSRRDFEINDFGVDDLLVKEEEIYMDKVNGADVSLMTLALADFSGFTAALISHDYYVALGMGLMGIILVVMYHRFGS